MEEVERYANRLDTYIRGDGNGMKGLLTRMTQVEKYIESQTWLMRTLITLVAGDLILKVIGLLKH